MLGDFSRGCNGGGGDCDITLLRKGGNLNPLGELGSGGGGGDRRRRNEDSNGCCSAIASGSKLRETMGTSTNNTAR
uniref:Uncharacterized protein n=1 Tax=Cannabis sativa TaxID=3483 RepID=A0A803PCL4_CANSA